VIFRNFFCESSNLILVGVIGFGMRPPYDVVLLSVVLSLVKGFSQLTGK